MIITRERRPASEAPFADLPFGLKVQARAAAERKDGHHTGKVLEYVDKPPLSLGGHEIDHILRDSKAHCPWWHCCGRVGHALRFLELFWRHLHPKAVDTAQALAALPPGVPLEVEP